ncbi:uncharacterized protein GGS22DRAFT_62938 [Annulohypoxylon maeteangense]|uniref:uncharacterized protein n=1 Tax=Annulohypoxylon maeteangense TaxID=1927788 RepID=UPI00200827DF|nr:uncharacterized protein GGS22DRAFT_62938 [Annulohypoxylon maeteangense]KAI0888769.1 hypothetical protein GGS22DRAFT_62938 [Annulohypoxylon maeteangense]
MSRLSRGCLRCRQRRVKCDEGKPSCQRCINRNEICEGYRDEASIVFRYETKKVIEQANITSAASSSTAFERNSRRRSHSTGNKPGSSGSSTTFVDPSDLTEEEIATFRLSNCLPWIKTIPVHLRPSPEDEAVNRFIEKYVIYPCTETSSPGFLEHLPSLFKDVNVEGRFALRWAVRAAAYADLAKDQKSTALTNKAFHCYGMSLSALGESLSSQGKVPDDHDLMTAVMLDIFETFFVEEPAMRGAHAQGMAQILRLRGSDQIYSPRGWSLFRLAHHRIQKQQLAFNLKPLDDSKFWFDQLDENEPSVRLEKDAFRISQTCERGRKLQEALNNGNSSVSEVLDMVHELVNLDQEVASWRQKPEWSFKTLNVSDLPVFDPSVQPPTNAIQLHADLWMAYEWNYHRTARIIGHQQLVNCLETAIKTSDLHNSIEESLHIIIDQSTRTMQLLADEVLSTVPQTFGDINSLGHVHDHATGPPRCRSIGGYLLLWPIKIIKGAQFATTPEQKRNAQIAFERIREYTGMKSHLGSLSVI